VKATFFVIGGELRKTLNKEKDRCGGHELGNHSYSHVQMLLVTPSFVRDEIERTDQLIRNTGYQGEIPFSSALRKRSSSPAILPVENVT
jgi:chitin deacetylase